MWGRVSHNWPLPWSARYNRSLFPLSLIGPVAQLVEHRTFNAVVAGSSPARLTIPPKTPSIQLLLYLRMKPSGSNSVVECQLPKLDVAGSTPVSRSIFQLGFGHIESFTTPDTHNVRGSVAYNFANDAWNSRNAYVAQRHRSI